MFDENVYRHIFSLLHDHSTLAALVCTCTLFRTIINEDVRHAKLGNDDTFGVFGKGILVKGQPRAKSLLTGGFRRQFLADLHAVRERGLELDGRIYAWDFCNLPVTWLGEVQLLATDQWTVLMYDRDLELLGALGFHDRQESEQARQQPRMFFGKLAMLLFKCPLECGVVFLEPPLSLGAADYLGPWRLQQGLGAPVAAAGGALAGLRLVDDDIHLLRQAMLRRGVLDGWRLLATPLSALLTGAMVAQATATRPALALHCLDLTGNATLLDESLAQLLRVCPHLRILRAARTNFGPACLSALCGRAAVPQSPPQAAQQQQQRNRVGSQPAGGSTDAPGVRVPAAGPAAQHMQHGQASSSAQHGRQPAASPQQQQASCSGSSCPTQLHTLDICHCPALSGSLAGFGPLLPRMLCHLPQLRDLRLSGMAEAGVVLDATERLGAAKGSGASAAALLCMLGQLTRLDLAEVGGCQALGGWRAARQRPHGTGKGGRNATEGDVGGRTAEGAGSDGKPGGSGGGLSWHHMELLTQNCTSLRQLAVSSPQLAAQQQDAGRFGKYPAQLRPSGAEPCRGAGRECAGEGRCVSCEAGGSPTLALDQQQGGQQGQHREQQQQPPGDSRQAFPSLLHLEVGWGAGGGFLWHAMLRSPFLASLTVHTGAALGDWHLRQLAGCCAHLARLELRGSNVSDKGLSCVLARCTQLTSLRLYSCAGPVSDALALSPPLAPRAPAFRLQELHLSWSNTLGLTDCGLVALLDPTVAALRSLVLRGCSGVTDTGVWPAVRQHAATLECLEFEEVGSLARTRKLAAQLGQAGHDPGIATAAACGTVAGVAGGGEHNSASAKRAGYACGLPSAAASLLPEPLTATAAVEALQGCLWLQAVTVRGSVVWDSKALQLFARRCGGVACAVLES